MPLLLDVPYSEKDEAKALGARWNQDLKKWYVPNKFNYPTFKKWILQAYPDGASIICNYLYMVEDCVICHKCKNKTKIILNAVGRLFEKISDNDIVCFGNISYDSVSLVLGDTISPLPTDLENYLKTRFNYYSDNHSEGFQYYNHCKYCNIKLADFIDLDKLDKVLLGNSVSSNFKLYRIHLKYDFITNLVSPSLSSPGDDLMATQLEIIDIKL